MNLVKTIGIGVLVTLLLIIIALVIRFRVDAMIDYEVSTSGIDIPKFTAADLDWEQTHDNSITLPFMASAIIDVDGDGVEEVFLGGGRSQSDVLFEFTNGAFQQRSVSGLDKAVGQASKGATVLDVDHDGDDDLLVARTDGIWLHKNTNGQFDATKLDATMPAGTTALGIGLGDINRDGHFDMFVSGYTSKDVVQGQNIFNNPNYGGSSQLFINNGDNTFVNATESAGLT